MENRAINDLNISEAYRKEIANIFSHYKGLEDYCQTAMILERVTYLATEEATRLRMSGDSFSRLLKRGIAVVGEIQNALNPLTRELSQWEKPKWEARWKRKSSDSSPDAVIWCFPNATAFLEEGENSGDYWPIEFNELDDAYQRYLIQAWMCCWEIDRILIDAALYSKALQFIEESKPQILGGGLLGLLLSSHRSALWKPALLRGTGWTLRAGICLLVSLIVGFSITDKFNNPGLGFLGGYAVWVLASVQKYVAGAANRILGKTIVEKLNGILDASVLMRTTPLSIDFVRDRIVAEANKGISWPMLIPVLLEKARQRNEHFWG